MSCVTRNKFGNSELLIKSEGYEESESTLENIFSLSRLYGDEKIDTLMNELRVADEDRISFTKFVRDSVSYAVASRFKLDYPMDNELLRENFQRLDSISLMSPFLFDRPRCSVFHSGDVFRAH